MLRLPRPVNPTSELSALLVLFTPGFPPRLSAARTLLAPYGPAVWHLEPAHRAQFAQAIGELGTEYARAVHGPADPVTIDVLRHLLAALILRNLRLPDPHGTRRDLSASEQELFLRFQHELERSFTTTRGAAHYAARLGYAPRTLNRASLP